MQLDYSVLVYKIILNHSVYIYIDNYSAVEKLRIPEIFCYVQGGLNSMEF